MAYPLLWDQLDLVEKQLLNGFLFFKEVKNFLSQFEEVENKYGKNMSKISIQQEKNVAGSGALRKAWSGMKSLLQGGSHHHKHLSKLTLDLLKSVVEKMEAYDTTRNELISEWKRDQKVVNKCSERYINLKKKYFKKGHDFEIVTAEWERIITTKPEANEKETLKCYTKRRSLKKEVILVFDEYKISLQALNDEKVRYQNAVKSRLVKIEKLEKERILYFKEVMIKFLQNLAQISSDQAYLVLTKTLNEINEDVVISNFVKENESKVPLLVVPELLTYNPNDEEQTTGTIDSSNKKLNLFSRMRKKTGLKKNKDQNTFSTPNKSNEQQNTVSKTEKTTKQNVQNQQKKEDVKVKENIETQQSNKGNENTQYEKYKALYSYEKNEEGEISFNEGDYLIILEKDESGWWQAQLGDKIGTIPSTYLAIGNETQEEEEENLFEIGDKVEAIYEFNEGGDGELIVMEGEILTVVNLHDGWFTGRNKNNEEGFVPINYVKKK
ncbi:sh3 and f-bar domain-containing protein [Anaeramoeba flamelloides]|uniref:Sh3 and f-bar domain-containing protein n=1 Tax=Anaeramoeba flamelloides TaxID=1746091 RepID=A0ABQ8XHR7_9EUKA|nr:sh3 and f-bar domain-containing protein [Anaeramoeba flamelloides]